MNQLRVGFTNPRKSIELELQFTQIFASLLYIIRCILVQVSQCGVVVDIVTQLLLQQMNDMHSVNRANLLLRSCYDVVQQTMKLHGKTLCSLKDRCALKFNILKNVN